MNILDQILAEVSTIKERLNAIPQAQEVVPPEIINTEELCKRLGLSEPTAITWRKKKAIPFIRIGSSIRYNWPKVVEALEKNKK